MQATAHTQPTISHSLWVYSSPIWILQNPDRTASFAQMGLDPLHVPAWLSVTPMGQQNTTHVWPEKGLCTLNTAIHLQSITFHRPSGVVDFFFYQV